MPIDCGGYAGVSWDDDPGRKGFTTEGCPPDGADCILLIDDGSERQGNACFGPSGNFLGWMFEAGLAPDEADRYVVGWKIRNK